MNAEFNLDILANAPTITDIRQEVFVLNAPFIDLAARFSHLPGTVLLLSGGELDCARYHILGLWPWLTLRGCSGQMHLTVDERQCQLAQDPFLLLEQIVAAFKLAPKAYPEPLAAGLLGYLAYDLKDGLEDLRRTSVDDLLLPQMLLHAHALTIVHDRQTHTTRLMLPVRRGGQAQTDQILQRFFDQMAAPLPKESTFSMATAQMTANFTQASYQAAVERIIDYIQAGDVYQVNLSQRFQVPFRGNAFALFKHLFELNPAAFFAFVQAGDHQIVSTSPELFLRQSGRQVETRPIKGTRPRGTSLAEDEALRAELAASAKDDAELSMIVDLLRNDLGKVCRAGSVRVSAHKRMEAYQNVFHLVSIVQGELEEKQSSVDLIRAAFPGGSITGCPKVRAMQIIDELEPCRRHLYCGSIGYIGFDDRMELSIAIRTATVVNDTLCFSVGGGVVLDSDPCAEYQETLHKGQTLMAACGADSMAHPAAMVWCNGRVQPAAATTIAINDQGVLYGYGFFETLRVDQGHAPLLAGHLARFARTWHALMPSALPDVSWQEIIAQVLAANRLDKGCAAVKILATRGSRAQAPWDHTLLVTARPYIHRLAGKNRSGLHVGTYPQARQSPLAEHKTLNYLYYLLAGQWALANGFDEALIRNPDGTVSETNTANLLVINGREVIRPASSAVLAGVMAGCLCQTLMAWGFEIIQRPLQPEVLLSAEQVLAANALMGALPILQIDGAPRPAGGDLWRRLNDAVIPGWDN